MCVRIAMCSSACLCLACGEVTSRLSDRRNLSGPTSQHVVPLWNEIIMEGSQRQNKALGLETGQSGYMCRRCFYAYEKCIKLKDALSARAKDAIDAVLSQSVLQASPRKRFTSCPVMPPPSKRIPNTPVSLATSSTSSPDFISLCFSVNTLPHYNY